MEIKNIQWLHLQHKQREMSKYDHALLSMCPLNIHADLMKSRRPNYVDTPLNWGQLHFFFCRKKKDMATQNCVALYFLGAKFNLNETLPCEPQEAADLVASSWEHISLWVFELGRSDLTDQSWKYTRKLLAIYDIPYISCTLHIRRRRDSVPPINSTDLTCTVWQWRCHYLTPVNWQTGNLKVWQRQICVAVAQALFARPCLS